MTRRHWLKSLAGLAGLFGVARAVKPYSVPIRPGDMGVVCGYDVAPLRGIRPNDAATVLAVLIDRGTMTANECRSYSFVHDCRG